MSSRATSHHRLPKGARAITFSAPRFASWSAVSSSSHRAAQYEGADPSDPRGLFSPWHNRSPRRPSAVIANRPSDRHRRCRARELIDRGCYRGEETRSSAPPRPHGAVTNPRQARRRDRRRACVVSSKASRSPRIISACDLKGAKARRARWDFTAIPPPIEFGRIPPSPSSHLP